MIGAIRTWDVLSHPIITIQCFGWTVFFRALVASEDETFLSLLSQSRAFGSGGPADIAELISQCMKLEHAAARIYRKLAAKFPESPAVQGFLETLARQETDHEELLGVCRMVIERRDCEKYPCWKWLEDVPRLAAQLQLVEDSLSAIQSESDALRLVLQLESSEINQVFVSVLRSTSSPFVDRLRAFQDATDTHISFICRRVPELAPHLRPECETLRQARLAALDSQP